MPILAVVLVAYPEDRFVRQVVDRAVDGEAVAVIVVPGAAAYLGQQGHGGVLVGYDAVCLTQTVSQMLVAVQTVHLVGEV